MGVLYHRPMPGRVLRFVVAGGVATVITLALFVTMTRLVDGSWILESIMRVFPLEQTTLEDPCAAWESERELVPIQGIVGYYGSDGFVPLHDAEIIGEHAPSDGQIVDVSPEGVFRFVTAFEDELPPACTKPSVPGVTGKRLLIRAAGCQPREIRITQAWMPHRVLLDCESRS